MDFLHLWIFSLLILSNALLTDFAWWKRWSWPGNLYRFYTTMDAMRNQENQDFWGICFGWYRQGLLFWSFGDLYSVCIRPDVSVSMIIRTVSVSPFCNELWCHQRTWQMAFQDDVFPSICQIQRAERYLLTMGWLRHLAVYRLTGQHNSHHFEMFLLLTIVRCTVAPIGPCNSSSLLSSKGHDQFCRRNFWCPDQLPNHVQTCCVALFPLPDGNFSPACSHKSYRWTMAFWNPVMQRGKFEIMGAGIFHLTKPAGLPARNDDGHFGFLLLKSHLIFARKMTTIVQSGKMLVPVGLLPFLLFHGC